MAKEITKDPQKENAMLKASMAQFARFGYHDTKTDEIVKVAGVSKGLLFHYFGNKANLYTTCYAYASQFFYQRVDYSVWTESEDLISMVINATKYKIQIQLDYPLEFNFLMRVFSEMALLPHHLKEEMEHKLKEDIQTNLHVMNPVIEKLPLREGLDPAEVMRVINTLLDSEMRRVQQEMSRHPEWQTMEDIEPLIDRIKLDLDILENGFMAR